MPDPFDKFTQRARRALTLAQQEAVRFNHSYIGIEHLLLGLLAEEEGVGATVLGHLGVDLKKAAPPWSSSRAAAAGVVESPGVTPESVRAEVTRILSATTPS